MISFLRQNVKGRSNMNKRLAKKILENKKGLKYSPHQIAKAKKRLNKELRDVR